MNGLRNSPVFPRLIGGVLLCAGILKAHQLVTALVPEQHTWITWALIEMELFVGLGLLASCFPWFFQRVALVLFACFLGTALMKVIAGDHSCGCAGNVPLSPWLAVVLDTLVLVALTQWRPEVVGSISLPSIFKPAALLLVLASMPPSI